MAQSSPVDDQPEIKTRDLDAVTPKTRSFKSQASDDAPAPAKQSFSQAFRAAKDGSTFEWNGKKYKKEYAKAPSKTRVSAQPPAASARGMNRADAADNSRGDASKAMADRAALDAKSSRAASESRAKAAREADSETRREARGQVRQAESTSGMGSKITYRPEPGARSIYDNAFANGGLVKARSSAKSHGKAC